MKHMTLDPHHDRSEEPTPMMKCGHAANAVDGSGKPCCVICFMAEGDASTQIAEAPNLEGRKAKCSYRNKRGGQPHTEADERSSSTELAFFQHHPDKPWDEYYCGCWRWD